MGIIAGLQDRSKQFLGAVPDGMLTVLVILLASSGSFGIGYLAGREGGHEGLRIETRPLEAAALSALPEEAEVAEPLPPMAAGGQYVASKNGSKYYLPWCGSAKNIKEENKVWFASKEEAEAKGYTPASNCPGL